VVEPPMSTLFFDIDTQLDFLSPAGALYVKGSNRIISAIARMNRHAAAHGIPVVSTVDAHTENDPEFKSWPHHCVAGTLGQRKLDATLLDRRVVVPNAPADLVLEGADQIVVEKQTVNAWEAPNFRRVVESLNADRFVVYGVVTEICVLHAARGLLKYGKSLVIVTDAVKELSEDACAATLRELTAAGATTAVTADFV
jgi:nicotinamidase/pyrazinamidase